MVKTFCVYIQFLLFSCIRIIITTNKDLGMFYTYTKKRDIRINVIRYGIDVIKCKKATRRIALRSLVVLIQLANNPKQSTL